MSNNFFKFKQFTIEQEGCAMKVGTDGCLLGAWFCVRDCKKILDVGAGTGLISIMAAQRSAAEITGIEIDGTAARQAAKNAGNSPWSDRVKIINADITKYRSDERFDAIVSNPPFFSNSLKCDDEQRNLARHNDSLTPAKFFECAAGLLTPEGKISVIIPCDSLKEWEAEAVFKGFSVHRATIVRTTPRKNAKRILVEFGRGICTTPLVGELILENAPGEYSREARLLLKEFYLKID